MTAVRELHRCYAPLTLSNVYESIAFGFAGENFYNLVAGFDTEDTVMDVAKRLTNIELASDRVRDGKNNDPRTLDIDLLLYGDLTRHDEHIDVPRSEISEYAFVLRPLAEIAPALRHPETRLSIQQMWKDFADRDQQLWSVPLDFGL